MDEERSIIDLNIAPLEETIRALKSRRNELSPISRLPSEILCNIFNFQVSLAYYWESQRPDCWNNFCQVSRHWRSSALSAPELWTNIIIDYPRWTQEMLKRSKKAKLTIRSGYPGLKPETIGTIRSCLYEMNRVEEIELLGIQELIVLEKIFRDLPKSAPQLHTLCIQLYSGAACISIDEDFLYDTKRLQCVGLTNCKISWDSQLLTGLTRLTLENSLKANPSITQVLHALRRMPALTHLHLYDSIPDDSEGPSTYDDLVDLPCLRELNISSGVDALTAFLHHISFPHSTILNLMCRKYQSTEIDFSKFLSVLVTKFLSSLVIRSLKVGYPHYIDETGGIEFYLCTTAIIQDKVPFLPNSQSQLYLVLSWLSPDLHHYVNALTCALDAMSLSFLAQLQISTSNEVDSQLLVKTFGKLPLLERVCLEGFAPNTFFDALVYKTKEAEKSKTAYYNVSFPKLRYIHLVGRLIANKLNLSVNKLLDCLMERYERNAEIEVLRLEDCFCMISSDELERLKEVVVDVIWDGRVNCLL